MNIISRIKYQLESVRVSKIFDLMTCPFKMILDKSISYNIFPDNHQAILGSVIHKMFQFSSQIKNSESFEKEWSKALDYELERNSNTIKLRENIDWHCKNYLLKKELVKTSVLKQLEVNFESDAKVSKEEQVSNEQFKGKPDYFLINGNYLLLKDFKSGIIFSSDGFNSLEVKKEIEAQLMICCGLICEQNPKISKADIFVVDNSGKKYKINKTIKDCLLLLSKTKSLLNEAYHHLKENNFSAIAIKNKNCRFCNGRYYCPHFTSFLEKGVYNKINDIAGELKEITKTKVGYNLKIKDNHKLNQVLSVGRDSISTQNLTSLVNKEVIVFNTVKSKNDNTVYYGTKNSSIFKAPLNEK